MTKTYEVTLARLAWIKSSVTVNAESWEDAFAKAKEIEDQADWPIDENGDVVIGFGDVEIDSAYCPSESEGHHEGEAPAADVMVYKAAPKLLEALKAMDAYWTADFPEGPDGSRVALGGFGEVSEDTMQVWRTVRAAIASAEG